MHPLPLTSNFKAGSGLCGVGCVGIGVVLTISQLDPFRSLVAGIDVVVVVAALLLMEGGGTETMERILALHTPLQQITVGSGRRLSTQTWEYEDKDQTKVA